MCTGFAMCKRVREEEPDMRAGNDNGTDDGTIQGNCWRRCTGASREFRLGKMSNQMFSQSFWHLLLVLAVVEWPIISYGKTLDEAYSVSPTPILHAADAEDLTTVLLVNNEGAGRLGDSHGRFLSIRPEVGLLTSTARTFIQEGVTTEYATQVVGTTLGNGRLYAQYLKKSSRVLFDNDHHTPSPSVVTSWVGDSSQTRSYLQSHNDLLNAESPDWQEVDDRLVVGSVVEPFPLRSEFVGNTDFIKTRAGHPGRAGAASKLIKIEAINDISSASIETHSDWKLAAHKVSLLEDLQTFTVKNYFEPSGYQTIKGLPVKQDADADADVDAEGRSAKLYQQDQLQQEHDKELDSHQAHNLPKQQLTTVKYFGFADFTTLVGDSLIVFLPSAAQPSSTLGHVTSIKVSATLRTSATSSETLLQPQPSRTSQLMSTTVMDLDRVSALELSESNNAASTSETLRAAEVIEFATKATPLLSLTEAVEKVNGALSDVKAMFSLPTDQEILEIYASLAKKNADVTPIMTAAETSKRLATLDSADTNVQVHGGATTIFIDDDPFANFVEPSSVMVLLASREVTSETADLKGLTLPANSDADADAETEAQTSTSVSNEEEEEERTTTPMAQFGGEERAIPVNSSSNRLEVESDISRPYDSTNQTLKCTAIESQVFLTQSQESQKALKSANKQSPLSIKDTTKYYCLGATEVVELPQLEKPSISMADLTSSIMVAPLTEPTGAEGTTPMEESFTESNVESELKTVRTLVDVDDDNDDVVDDNGDDGENAVTDSAIKTDYDNDDDHYSGETDFDEEDLIYKTLYTTYTYLTTFFQGQSTSVSSHTEIVTNIITSTLSTDSDSKMLRPTNLADATQRIDEDSQIVATQTLAVNAKTATSGPENSISTRYMIPEELENLLQHGSFNNEVDSQNTNSQQQQQQQQTTYLNDSKYTKTFYTTYTYYTTIFADSETEIMSRTEIFSNYVTEDIRATKAYSIGGPNPHSAPQSAINDDAGSGALGGQEKGEAFVEAKTGGTGNVTLITDVRSSSSNGEQKVIGKVIRDQDQDQVSSESNTEEILPSATLLLQTSFTTFTFYTTMYAGDSTNVASRLETVTNIVTETLQPTKMFSVEDATLPVTYFTTFTFWTKLAKDGEITTISREETISNVVEPTKRLVLESNEASNPKLTDGVSPEPSDQLTTLQPPLASIQSTLGNSDADSTELSLTLNSSLSLTTFYTTFTYYTTSYEGDNTLTDSRLETVTNIVEPSNVPPPTESVPVTSTTPTPHPDFLQSAVSTAKADTSITKDALFYDYKHIIDADGISTLYFTTQVQALIDSEGLPIEVTSSTSSLYIDEGKKSSLIAASPTDATDFPESPGKPYKTGLVRLIEGTRVGNNTTTLYQSKVIGTIIDNRYAQIIESTSSFIFEKAIGTVTARSSASAAAAVQPNEELMITSTQEVNLHSIPRVESSMNSDSVEIQIEMHGHNQSSDNGNDSDDDSKSNSENGNRNIFSQTKKHTFAPVIRPFASRNRPTFLPKQKNVSPSSATIITRSDITPTITATPALKTVARYNPSRRGALPNAPINPLDSGSSSPSTRRLFGRPIKAASSQGPSSSSGVVSASGSGFAPSRNRFASSTRSVPVSSSRRFSSNASLRPSSSIGSLRASALGGLSRQRFRPSTVFGQPFTTTSTTPSLYDANADADADADADGDAEAIDTSAEEPVQNNNEEEENNAQNSRRNQNPLFRLRRPLTRPSGFTAVPRANANSTLASNSPRHNPLTGRGRTSTTTSTTTTSTPRPRPRSFLRPAVNSLQARPRPQNSLFPPRSLFQKNGNQEKSDKEENGQNESANEESIENDEREDDADGDGDNDGDGDGDDDEGVGAAVPKRDEARRRKRSHKKVVIELKHLRRRREADTINRNRFRFRRPKTATTEEPVPGSSEELPETTPNAVGLKPNSRFGSRYQPSSRQTSKSPPTQPTNYRAIRPTRPQSPRSQFTLREKDTIKSIARPGAASNFRRQQPALRRNPTASNLSSSRRLKSYNHNHTHNNSNGNNAEGSSQSQRSSGTSTSRSRNVPTRGRNTMNVRGRSRNDYNNNLDDPGTELGSVTITVTHLVPAEVTVPVVNGQVTEYKNIVTGKASLEVVGPHQYTQVEGNNRQSSLFLTREESSVNLAGATEVTRFLLHGSLTSTVTFTPTTIRGRKTSFSHILPSTVYSVENVVSTLQPQLAANAPLANILLSQLLLGNINLPSNPLLGALGQPQPQPQLGGPVAAAANGLFEPSVAGTPVTEYRTHTSTYVTTIYDGKSTILPITFQGKKILTTVFDTTAQTITATEYSVDTIINTPSPQIQIPQPTGQAAQVNSLLLQQLLLQQQQQQQQQQLQIMPQIMQTASPQILLSDNLQHLDEAFRHDADADVDALNARDNIDDIINVDNRQQMHSSSKSRKKSRKSSKSGHKRSKQQQQQQQQDQDPLTESSIVTLYVSGRRPGEFSTILSTVHNSVERVSPSSLHKRHAHHEEHTVALHSPEDIYEYGASEKSHSYLRPLGLQNDQANQNLISADWNTDDCGLTKDCELRDRTATLESIIGDVALWQAKATRLLQPKQLRSQTMISSNGSAPLLSSIHFLA